MQSLCPQCTQVRSLGMARCAMFEVCMCVCAQLWTCLQLRACVCAAVCIRLHMPKEKADAKEFAFQHRSRRASAI